MGFSLTGTHVIFFVTSVIIAGTVSAAFMAVIMNTTISLSDRGDRMQEQLDTEFKIINDNENIPNEDNHFLFYLKNIGRNNIITTNVTYQLFVDGDLISMKNYYFSNDSFYPGDVVTIYIANTEISSGDHILKIVGPLALSDEFMFTI